MVMPLVRWVRRKMSEKFGKKPIASGRAEGLACVRPVKKPPKSKA